MAQIVRRRGYRWDRVLIESARLLDPQFDPVSLTATGAQVEMLRNLMEYLKKTSTYVAEYHKGYYLTATVEDYDSIQAIVADLQDKLMNGGTPVSDFDDRYSEWLGETKSGAGTYVGESTPVPADKILILEHIFFSNITGTRDDLMMYVEDESNGYVLEFSLTVPAGELFPWDGRLTLKEGDVIVIEQEGCQDEDEIIAGIWGYTFDV